MSTLNTGQVSAMIGVPVTGDLLTQLGFNPAGKDRRALLWAERDFEKMCDALAKYIVGRKSQTRPAAKPPKQPKPITPIKKSKNDFVPINRTADDEDDTL